MLKAGVIVFTVAVDITSTMKASLKLREGQKPLVRAKIPINILGLPLISGIAAGDSKELCLHLGTFWDAGPAVKVAYKPNDTWNPFSMVLKTGIGEWGSPSGAALAMTAEINLLGRGNPSFCLNFKPQFGDFTIKKSVRSSLVLPPKQSEEDGLFGSKHFQAPFIPEAVKSDLTESSHSKEATPSRFQMNFNGFENGSLKGREEDSEMENGNGTLSPKPSENKNGFALNMAEKKSSHKYQIGETLKELKSVGAEKLLEGFSLTAHSRFPVRKHAVVQVRWGVKLPLDLLNGWEAGNQSGFSTLKLPCLFLEKVSIENVEHMRSARKGSPFVGLQSPLENLLLPVIREEANELAHITGICYSMRRQLHILRAENRVLKKAMEDMSSELEHKGIRNSNDNFPNGEASSWQKPLERAPEKDKAREANYRESDKKKTGTRDNSKKESKAPNGAFGNDFPTSTGNSAVDVSEELKKAIRGAS